MRNVDLVDAHEVKDIIVAHYSVGGGYTHEFGWVVAVIASSMKASSSSRHMAER